MNLLLSRRPDPGRREDELISAREVSRADLSLSKKTEGSETMALFGKKTPSQKRPIIEVIKYNGPNDVLVWRFPNEDFNTNTKLIVGPAQEAIFVKGGQVLGRFLSGTYTLSTKNHPFLRSLVELATGGVSPFSCVVYYINKVVSMGIEWGTDRPISVLDPIYRVPVDVRSYGDFSLQVADGLKLMEKLVGQTQGYSQDEVRQFFGNLMATQVRGVISGTILERGLSTIGIDAHLADMSVAAAEKLRPIFEPYGMALNHFTIAAVTTPELDVIKQKARDLQTHRMETDVTAEDKKKYAMAQAFENIELGINEQQKMVGRAMEKLAGNPGPAIRVSGGAPFQSGEQSSAGSAAEMARLLLHQQPEQSASPLKGGVLSGKGEASGGKTSSNESFEQRAKKVKFLLDNGMISQEQFQEKMAQLMDEI